MWEGFARSGARSGPARYSAGSCVFLTGVDPRVRLKYCSTVACISYLVPSLRRQSLDSHKSQYLVESGSTSRRDERQQLNSSPRVRLSKRFYNARQKRSVAVVFVATSQAGREVLHRTAKAVCGSWDARNCKPVNRTEDRSG